jgi:alkylated DNA repair dioxygenase AlkB
VDRSITNHQSTQSVLWNDGPMMMADACVQPHPPYYYYRSLRHHQGHYGRVLLFAVFLLCGGILPLPVVNAFAARNHIENNNAARRPRQRQPTTADGGTRSSGGRNSNIIQNKTPPTTVLIQQPSLAWWIAELQKCRSAQETIERICRRLPTPHQHQEREGTRTASSSTPTAVASPASMYSLILVRLSRQLLSSSTVMMMDGSIGDPNVHQKQQQQQVHLDIDDVDAIRQMVLGLTRTTTEPPEGPTTEQSSKTSLHDDEWTKQRCRRTEQWLADCVEGTKAAAIVARSLSICCSSLFLEPHESVAVDPGTALGLPLREFWKSVLSSSSSTTTKSTTHDDHDSDMVSLLSPPAMTGLKWAMDTFGALHTLADEPQAKRDDLPSHNGIPNGHNDYYDLPPEFWTAYDGLKIPFEVVPKGLDDTLSTTLTVPSLVAEVDFRADTIQTAATGRSVRERRYTAWQGDDGIAAFAYSGKSMARADWTASVRAVRDRLYHQTDGRRQYYDGCLVNYYPNGESAMRYHRDPDQGTLWDYDTAVVSIGSPRPFSFRRKHCPSVGGGDNDNGHGPTAPEQEEVEEIHNFVVFHGDVTHMFADCQARFEHTVKKAGVPDSPRISLVFKRSFGSLDGSTV